MRRCAVNELSRRRRKRKAKIKYLIEKAVKNPSGFISTLAADGLSLFIDPKKGICVKMTDSDGKEYRYGLTKDLGIDINIIPPTVVSQLQPPKVAGVQSPKVTHSNSPTNSPTNSRTGNTRLAGIKDAPSGSSRNAEHEIRDGHGYDDPDEQWKRNNGFKI